LKGEYLHTLRISTDLRPLFEDIKSDDVDYVLLGEASHEPSDFYRWRTEITTHTTHLISNDGFSFIVVEGDWPDCYNVNRYVKGLPESKKVLTMYSIPLIGGQHGCGQIKR